MKSRVLLVGERESERESQQEYTWTSNNNNKKHLASAEYVSLQQ